MGSDKLIDWAEKGADPNRTFSGTVVARLFLAIFLVGLPAGVFQLVMHERERAKEEAARQAALQVEIEKIEKQIEAGQAGEAVQRLFGIKPKQPVKPRPKTEIDRTDANKQPNERQLPNQ